MPFWIKSLEELQIKANKILEDFNAKYLELLSEEKDSINNQKVELFAELQRELSKKKEELKLIVKQIGAAVEVQLGRINAASDVSVEKLEEYNPESHALTGNGDIRWKKVNIAEDKQVDIDISFGVKTNKVQYSSDECLRDRLSTIKELYPDQYNNVIANIILAKRVLKDPEVNAYKPRRTDSSQGGMGGIGIENWILQNGGSFVQACHSF